MLPLPCEMIQFDKYAFSMGWNHQIVFPMEYLHHIKNALLMYYLYLSLLIYVLLLVAKRKYS